VIRVLGPLGNPREPRGESIARRLVGRVRQFVRKRT